MTDCNVIITSCTSWSESYSETSMPLRLKKIVVTDRSSFVHAMCPCGPDAHRYWST